MKVAFYTLGCKVNQYETQAMRALFEAAGHTAVPFDARADAYVVNTCTVTQTSDHKSRAMLARAHRLNPDAPVVAVGCYAQLAPDEFICSKKLGRPGLIKFLRGFARDLFYWRVDKYAQVIGVEPLGVKVTEAQARWGSCSAQNVLNFSWRLIFAPPVLLSLIHI